MTAHAFVRLIVGSALAFGCAGIGIAAAQTPFPAPAPAPAPRPAPSIPTTPQIVNPNPSPAAVAVAREIITLKGANQMFDAIVPGVIETAKNQFIPTNPTLNAPLNEVAAQLRKEYEPKRQEVLNEVAKVYARRFTEQELREIVAFYKTALGRKLLVEDPAAIEDGLKRAQDWANDFSEQVIGRMRLEMKKKGYDL